MAKCLKGLDVYTKGLSTKVTHSRISACLKPSLISRTDPISGTIQPTAMKNTLTSTANEHHGRKNCLGSLRSAQGRERKRKERKKRENNNVALEACIFLVSPPHSPTPPDVKFPHFIAHFSAAVQKIYPRCFILTNLPPS